MHGDWKSSRRVRNFLQCAARSTHRSIGTAHRRRNEEGLLHIAAASRDGGLIHRECHFGPRGREEVRLLAARGALELPVELLNGEGRPGRVTGKADA